MSNWGVNTSSIKINRFFLGFKRYPKSTKMCFRTRNNDSAQYHSL